MMKDKVKRLELSDDLINKYGIIDAYYNSEKIEIMYTNKNGKDDVITLAVMKYASDSINQLDSLVNGSMSLEAFTHLKHYLSMKLEPRWNEIYIPYIGKVNDEVSKSKSKGTLEQELTQKYCFKSMKDTKEIYYYDTTNGIYLKDADWLIEQECIKYYPEIGTKDVNDIKNRIIWSNYIDRTEFDPDIEWLCCKNVMINLLTGESKKHDPNFMATVQIPHTYVNLDKTPCKPLPYKILNFLHEVMSNDDDVETVLDFIAYCLWRGFPFHKWLLFNGSGRNGKGVTTELITRFIGYKNVSNETLHRLLSNNFATASLYNKMINVDADLSSDEFKQTGMLKKLTGNDWIIAEHKFKEPFHYKNYAKLIFSANKMPITPDESDAFFVRPIIINFPNQYLGDKADPYLIEKLTTEAEMSALLNLILKRLPRVLKDGISRTSTIDENYTKYMQSSDPIRLFAETSTKKVLDALAWETKDSVYSAYEKFCSDRNLPKESSETFSRKFKQQDCVYKQKNVKGVNTYVWINIIIIDNKEADQDQDTL